MTKFTRTAMVLTAGLLLAPATAEAECKLLRLAEFHVDPAYRSPLIDGAINGAPIKILIDSGSGFSMVHRAAADRLGLPRFEIPGERAYGVGGSTGVYDAHIKELKIGDLVKDDMDLEVAGDANQAWEASLILGADFLAQVDVEFDLPHNAVRLFRHVGCEPPQLVYWGAGYSQAPLLAWDRDAPKLQSMAQVDGHSILAELDSGASSSVVDSGVVALAGGTEGGGTSHMRGLGAAAQSVTTARFASFALGDEKISNVTVGVTNLKADFNYSETGSMVPRRLDSTPSMLIGADFFRAHRVYFDVADHLILFSYVGGPVFSPPAATPPPDAKTPAAQR